ncbi:hypothetical protein [Ktedonobacter sp. SOSP1-52]|uniref:hypothetical protein n=1 Tax=Ktedonobacter sp. SOSP1-52 TaxID=2778366 RepID=UPI0019162923|nr:hypothetical protein [Ktedonobacter sp. SOSP1-52]
MTIGKKKSKAGLQRTQPFAGGGVSPQKPLFLLLHIAAGDRWDVATALRAMGSLLLSGILYVIFNLLKHRFFKQKGATENETHPLFSCCVPLLLTARYSSLKAFYRFLLS